MKTRSQTKAQAEQQVIPFDQLSYTRSLGEGAFGKVFLGEWNGTRYAVKKTSHEKMFKAEVEILSLICKLQAPNVVQFYGSSGWPHYSILLEYLPNASIEEWIIEAEPFEWQMRYVFMRDTAEAVNFLHQHNIIHRDIKPGNILLTSDYRAKLCDFGISVVGACREERPIGTREYFAPEVHRKAEYTNKSDIYALGITFWEIASWDQVMVDVTESKEMLALKEQGQLEPMPADCPPSIAEIIKKSWLRWPAQRPDASSVLKEIHEAKEEVDKVAGFKMR